MKRERKHKRSAVSAFVSGKKPHLFGMGFSTPREDEQINIEPEDDGFGRCFSEFPGGVRILRFQPLIFWGVSIFVGR